MKKLNNNGVSLAETLAATVILGIVVTTTIFAVNSRGKQLSIVSNNYEVGFDLNNSSNEAYLEKGFDGLNNKTYVMSDGSSHIIKKGNEIDSSLTADKSYLVSSITVEGKDYQIVREVSKGTTGDEGQGGDTGGETGPYVPPDGEVVNPDVPFEETTKPEDLGPGGTANEELIPEAEADIKKKLNLYLNSSATIKDVFSLGYQYNPRYNKLVDTKDVVDEINVTKVELQNKIYSSQDLPSPDYREYNFCIQMDIKHSKGGKFTTSKVAYYGNFNGSIKISNKGQANQKITLITQAKSALNDYEYSIFNVQQGTTNFDYYYGDNTDVNNHKKIDNTRLVLTNALVDYINGNQMQFRGAYE